ncbi:MAG: hypothetical protein ACTHU0_33700, partial [Kofleriaceae bacterium]
MQALAVIEQLGGRERTPRPTAQVQIGARALPTVVGVGNHRPGRKLATGERGADRRFEIRLQTLAPVFREASLASGTSILGCRDCLVVAGIVTVVAPAVQLLAGIDALLIAHHILAKLCTVPLLYSLTAALLLLAELVDWLIEL